MLQRLIAHLELLKKYISEYEQTKDFNLLGEIAGKLRLLVWKGGRNKPLLIRLAREYEIQLTREFDRPDGTVHISLDEYLEELAYFTTVEEVQYKFTVMDLITLWSHQSGAAHEDWNIDKKFDVLLNSSKINFELLGFQSTQGMFVSHARSILNYGYFFLHQLKKRST